MRTPSPFLLRQCVTLYNKLPSSSKPINGGYAPQEYKRVVLRSVKYIQQEGAITSSSHGAVSDSLHLMIFPGISEADEGEEYAAPEIFENASDRSKMWTLQKGFDYIALGSHNDPKPSIEGKGNRNDFKISTVDVRYNPNGTIHHFEVNAR